MPTIHSSTFPPSEVCFQTVESWIEDSIQGFYSEYELPKIRSHKRSRKIDMWETRWGRWLLDPELRNERSGVARMFRNKFRTPAAVFDLIVEKCREENIFDIVCESKCRVPLEFKVLICLRLLGRGNVADDVSEMSGAGRSTVSYLLKSFCRGFVAAYYEEHVQVHQGLKMEQCMRVYQLLGLPGAFGSMDATHVHWNSCDDELRFEAIGKEGFPTLGFMCMVDHFKYIQYCSAYHLGGQNDKGIMNDDIFCLDMIRGKFGDVQFDMFIQSLINY